MDQEPAAITSPRRWKPEALCLLIVAAAAFSTGLVYLETWGGIPQFWQPMFGPAVMWSCGRGYVNPALSQAPELEQFLLTESDCIPCSAIPTEIETAPPGPDFDPNRDWKPFFPHANFADLIPYQHFHLYLLGAASLIWRVTGPSWSALYPFFALLYAFSALAGYGLFRLGMRRSLAVICALLLIIAPLHLQQLPHYRDYAKAPFMLAAIWLMGLLAVRTLKPRAVLALSALGGAIIGLGLGFRPDVNVCVIPFVIVLAVFFPGTLRSTWKIRLGAVVAFGGAYALLAWPILNALNAGSNMPHWFLLGLFSYCDVRLGAAAPLYNFGGPYQDFYIRTLFQSYAQRMHACTEPLHISTPRYDAMGQAYLFEILWRFPADLALRGYASVLRVLDEMNISPADPAPRGVTQPFLVAAYGLRATALGLIGGGRYAAGLALAIIAGANIRLGLCALFLLLYFAGYPAIQFNLRHCFHLEFLSLWVLGFLAQRFYDAARNFRAIRVNKAALWRASLFTGIAALLIALPVAALRVYQRPVTEQLIEAAASAPAEAVVYRTVNTGTGTTRIEIPDLASLPPVKPEQPGLPVQTQYVILEFDDTDRPDIPLLVRYTATDPMYDFSRDDLWLPAPKKNALDTPRNSRVLIPLFTLSPSAYAGDMPVFTGFELRTEHARFLRKVYRVTDLSQLPLLMTLTLPSDWREAPLRQMLTR